LRRLRIGGVSDSQLPRNLSNWITSATKDLLALMPQDYSDYKRITEVQSQYIGHQNILLPSATEDVQIIMKNLIIAYDCVAATIKAEHKDIPPENLTSIYYDQLRKSAAYVKDELIERLKGKENGKTSRTAMLHIYGRIYLWVQSAAKLDEITDCLTLAGCLRAILELYIDLNLFACKIISGDIEKYFSFQRIDKWNKARNIIRLRAYYSTSPSGRTTPVERFLDAPENKESEINALREQIWGKNKKGKPFNPRHWSNMYLEDRVRSLKSKDIAEIYISSYYWCNFFVHSMYHDAFNNATTVHLFNWRCYNFTHKMFLRATKLINEVTRVIPAEELEGQFENIEAETFKLFFGEMVKAGRGKMLSKENN